ncbi:ATP-dependent Clp protease ATP-binding subunit [Rossellomorea vietnamensis]|uniref:ATP-dependent Clp protease ATP-binding subunit n=1 Tax=Rossellomorea vietnamensis TaxID=218284 RepID=A0A5D4M7Z3_9BACI|nr:ATP-dependent Clp protease ATP-binding subunit [Rossellomorea vietnamensis]TYR97608.1 ATP-dependent Clp protease ATP-binding subunit [Rossellomorea vietnamensis]
MICQNCNEKTAKVNLQFNINGRKKSLFLCQECYSQEKELINTGHNPFQNFSGSQGSACNQQGAPQPAAQKKRQEESFLDQYGRNLTHLAKADLIDPVIGRNDELERMIEVLNRRNKNNPVLIGEPGVGKTAIAEGLAIRIAEGHVPSKLLNKEVILLDVASLVANTGIRGQFEERIKALIEELQTRKNILLFIDEIHLIVGAGSAEGSMDAGNILKPALARGELQLIGATTLKEYRQIEKDAALERRFQPIHVKEPSEEAAIKILKGLQKKYEDFHEVKYSDEAIESCVILSKRYIQDRFLPDKAIDLLDEAGSHENLRQGKKDRNDVRGRLSQIAVDKENALSNENYELAAKLRDEEIELEEALQSQDEKEHSVVNAELIQELIEKKTGIPVGKLQEDEQQKMKELQMHLSNQVIGQEEAVKTVSKAIRRSRAGLKNKNRPIGSFLFIGPTGVGKTELSKTLAKELFGTSDSMIRLDMSEYMEKHSISKLIGSPPGYVGHEESGQLSEKVRRNPYSIILLDEIEKAHPDVQHMFLQILEDGRLTDSQGRTVSFKDAVIIMTSNAGVGIKEKHVGFTSHTMKETSILDNLKDYFKPEFLNRFDNIVEFNSLNTDDLKKIVDILLTELYSVLEEQDITLTVTDEAKEKLVEDGYHPDFGARPLRRIIQEKLEDTIADFILDHPDKKQMTAVLEQGEIIVR